jgi:formylglycine-generating enzyme required for sulfatase activity
MSSTPQCFSESIGNNVAFDMLLVEGGNFDMGGADDEAIYREKPVHPVNLGSFYLGKYPVTQQVWQAVMGNNPSHFNGSQRPVERVSWRDTQEFIKKLNHMTKKHYRLPSEAEWEYAARGGIHRQQDGYIYAGSDKLKEVGWYGGNSDGETKAVGLKYPNELGLYDMSGNVWEWCDDWFDEKYYQVCDKKWVVQDPQGPKQGVNRVIRGGGCLRAPRFCRVAYRLHYGPAYRYYDLGFRLALSRQLTGKPDGYR